MMMTPMPIQTNFSSITILLSKEMFICCPSVESAPRGGAWDAPHRNVTMLDLKVFGFPLIPPLDFFLLLISQFLI